MATRMTHRLEDGTLLLSDFYAAADHSRRTLLLLRSDRPRDIYRSLGELLSSRGYGLLVQSVRGRGGSGGFFIPYQNEGADGAAVVAQLHSSEAFANDRLVLVGEGYAGQAALAASVRCSPGMLSGVALADVTDNFFTDGLCTNGVLTGWALQQLLSWCVSPIPFIDLDGYWRWQGGASPLNEEPMMEFWALSMRDTQEAGGIWGQPDSNVDPQQLMALHEVPLLLLASYSSMKSAGACHLASRLMALKTKRLEFDLGEWDAPFWIQKEQDSSKEGAQVCGMALKKLLAWLDRLFYGREECRQSDDSRKVGYFMHEVPAVIHPWQNLAHRGRWCTGRGLLSGGANRCLFLRFGRLSEQVPAGQSAVRSCYVSEGSRGLRVTRNGGQAHASSLCAPAWGPGHCLFYGSPLTQPLVLCASMRLHLWCTCSRGDAVIGARLVAEVPTASAHGVPARRSMLLSRGVARIGFRYGMGQLVSSENGGTPVEVIVPFLPAAWTLPAGCRLRLEIGDCESPLWIPPPRPDARSPDVAGLPVQNTICIYHDNDHRSRLVY